MLSNVKNLAGGERGKEAEQEYWLGFPVIIEGHPSLPASLLSYCYCAFHPLHRSTHQWYSITSAAFVGTCHPIFPSVYGQAEGWLYGTPQLQVYLFMAKSYLV